MGLRIALVQSPAWGVDCPPYGIAVLKGFLEKQGHKARAHDLNVRLYNRASAGLKAQWAPDRHQFWMDEGSVEHALGGELAREVGSAVEEILAQQPRLVGFTTLFSNQAAALHLARQVKRRSPKTLVVFGGPQASRRAGAEAILGSRAADYCVEGEGELALLELAGRLERRESPEGAPGLTYRRQDRLVETPPPPRLTDLAALPFADFSDFPMLEYRDVGCVPVSLSRGCPNQCVFCYEVQYWERFRARKAESLVREVGFMRKTLPAVNWLWFHDSLINGNMLEMRKFAQGLIDAKIPTRWAAQAVIRKDMTRDVLQLLKDSGCISLNYGLESASFSVMLKMGKVLAKGADVDRIVRDTFEVGIDCVLNFMFGFPGESEEDFQASLDFVARNKDWITMVQPSPGFCDFYRGTYGYEHPEQFGIELNGGSHWSSLDGRNTYLTRMERFERFLELVNKLGLKCSYPHERLYLRNTIVGNYLFNKGRFDEALPYLEEAARSEPPNEIVSKRVEDCRERTGRLGLARRLRKLAGRMAGRVLGGLKRACR